MLLSKLESLGVGGSLLAWISAFLSVRVMSVSVSGRLSSPVDVTSGVPQGSVLGPLLFLIYINHISSGLACRFKAFADDYKLYLGYSVRTQRLLFRASSHSKVAWIQLTLLQGPGILV